MINPIKSIAIVGGGTSAWLSAAYLYSKCPPDINITVIDKFDGSPIGVGEATLVNFISFMKECGFSEKDWFNEVDAVIKGGILFKNWKTDTEDIWHPFAYSEFGSKYDTGITLWSNNRNLNFIDYGLPEYDLFVSNKKINEESVQSVARHIDCGKLVNFLKKTLLDKISFINSEVIQVIKNDNGCIESVVLKNNQHIKCDLYLDCTGFKRVLNEKGKKIFLTDRLFCDTAIAGPIPYKDRKRELSPYTTCDAVEHGWIWKTPIQSRIGSGLVFNRKITDIESAKDYYVNYWNGRIKKEDLKVIDWTPYHVEKFWENNVVSIGLSAGFIEPLESTGLHFIQMGVSLLEGVLRNAFYSEDDISLYNIKMSIAYDETVDYVGMHYFDSNKTGKFWDFVREKTVNLNERTKFYLDLMKNGNRYVDVTCGGPIFGTYNWILWLIQLGYPIEKFQTNFNKVESLNVLRHYHESCSEVSLNSVDADIFCDSYLR